MLSFWLGFRGAPDDLDSAVETRMQRQKVSYELT
jgi:hypothetical protein